MYLKSIRAFGFKSFADKLNIELNNGITAIVGPNGSGKSNIVDAIKWVLGEQSIKTLRGSENMTDVIFSGSKSRTPSTRASVALTFDNSDHYLNCDYSEIEIKRIVYKTGENEYFINNNKVRLKDITNLFLDSGAGNDSFNIISQGSVADIINGKPESRRVIIEEAAGVRKYKKRKEESLKKLERTKDNLEKVTLLIDELSTTIEPLKKEAEVAKIYLNIKNELESIEISLLAEEISKSSEQKAILDNNIESLKNELVKENSSESNMSADLEKNKLQKSKLEDEINKKSNELFNMVSELSKLNSEKNIALERQKYQLDKEIVDNNFLELKSKELKIEENVSSFNADILTLNEELTKLKTKLSKKTDEMLVITVKKTSLQNELNVINKKGFEIKNKINYLEESLENDGKLPKAVKYILNSKEKGVKKTINQALNIPYEYLVAINTALGQSANFLIVDDEAVAKKCIIRLKENKVGRATFFPLNIIKSKKIDSETLNIVKSKNAFVASEVVKYDNIYDNIIKNQLGNIIITKDIDAASELGKLTNYKYRIVTLNGEIIHSGGSLTGGSDANNYSSIMDKKNLEDLKNEFLNLNSRKNTTEVELEEYIAKYNELNEEIIAVESELAIKKELKGVKEKALNEMLNDLDSLKNEREGMQNLENGNINSKIVELLEAVSAKTKEKELLEHNLNSLKAEYSDLNNEIAKIEQDSKAKASNINKLQNDLHKLEVELSRVDALLDNNLLTLSENYNMSYEKARDLYILDMPYEMAKEKEQNAKKEMQKLGDVNTGSIKEYDRLKNRYDFLFNQRDDLTKACESLMDVISEMDEIMIERFNTTFEKINDAFKETFKKLFKGGIGNLVLTNPDDILTTGIDITAEPPGKKLNSIGLLSGGEKTLTAIALIFAILSIKTVPFCVFDEVEAALDESNVDVFGSYLQEEKEKSQFILITHKKRTMEYADSLYGITMQESGVSKIVSVKLEN